MMLSDNINMLLTHKVILFGFDPLVFDYDTEEEGNIIVRKLFIEFDMTQIGE